MSETWTLSWWWMDGSEQEFTETYDDDHLEEMRRKAMRIACLNGAIAWVIRNPDGEIVAHWDRYSGIAHNLLAFGKMEIANG